MVDIRFFDEDENGESTSTQDLLGQPESQNNKYADPLPAVEPQAEYTGFDPSILSSELDFGAGHKRLGPALADYLAANGREDEAFERDE